MRFEADPPHPTPQCPGDKISVLIAKIERKVTWRQAHAFSALEMNFPSYIVEWIFIYGYYVGEVQLQPNNASLE